MDKYGDNTEAGYMRFINKQLMSKKPKKKIKESKHDKRG